MNVSQPPVGDDDVPDKVLDELTAAFGGAALPDDISDLASFDDPSIDLLLDINQPEPEPDAGEFAIDSSIDVWRPTVDTSQLAAVQPETLQSETLQPETLQPETREVDAALAGEPAPQRRTIVIGGEDQPDAMYFDEEGTDRLRGGSVRTSNDTGSTERNTILIVGDEVEGQSGGIPLAASSASMDPRLRARRIAVRREIGKRRLQWLVFVGGGVLLVAGALTLLGSSLFSISSVVPSGARRIDPQTLQIAIDDLMGTPALLVDTGSIERKLELSPWVQRARVSVSFPHSATIEIVERVPIATYAGSDGRFRIMAADGVVVDVIAGQPIDFMLIRGSGLNVEAGNSAGVAFTRAAALVEALSPTVRSLTLLVNVADNGDLSLIFKVPGSDKEGATVILGSPSDLLDKLTRLEAFLQRPGSDQCSLINVSTSPISHKC